MALGGGTYVAQNKILPGAYINFVSQPRAMGTLGERGTVCMAVELDWGSSGMICVEAGAFQTEAKSIFGYEYTHEKMKPLRDLFLYAKKALLYRCNSGQKATATAGGCNIEAKYGGTRGNDIRIIISKNIDDETAFDVKTYLDLKLEDTQTVKKIEDLTENTYVTFQGTGSLEANAGVNLTGGTNKEVTGSDYSDFLEEAEKENFNVLAYAGEDNTTKGLFTAFTKRLRDEEGIKFVTVLFDYTKADFEGIISVTNETEEEKTALVYWTAGIEAGAEVNESVTNKKYDGEYSIKAKYKKSRFIEGIQKGEFLYYEDGEDIRVLRDINTFTSFESSKNSDFSSNRVVRVLDAIANDVARIFSQYYLGKQSNNANGRNLLKAELIQYHEQLQAMEAIEGFIPEDITISQGVEKQDVVVYEKVRPTDAMEKLYMKVEVI